MAANIFFAAAWTSMTLSRLILACTICTLICTTLPFRVR